jgi:hypothetical protein
LEVNCPGTAEKWGELYSTTRRGFSHLSLSQLWGQWEMLPADNQQISREKTSYPYDM